MATRYTCGSPKRREAVLDPAGGVNGIDYLEVLDTEVVTGEVPADVPRQRTLLVHFLKPLAAATLPVRIEGGIRITPVRADWAFRADAVPAAVASAADQTFYQDLPEADHVLIVRTDSAGDY